MPGKGGIGSSYLCVGAGTGPGKLSLEREEEGFQGGAWQWGPEGVRLWARPTMTVPTLQNLLRVGSALLDAANKRHWELIQQTEGGTAWLLQHYEAYASALAQNMRHTYLSPFTIVTPNIGEVAAPGGAGRGS